MGLLGSPRRRRRFAWAGAALGVAAAIGALVLLIPNTTGNLPDKFSDEPVQVVTSEHGVPVTAAIRRDVNALFDAFVPAAVARRDPPAAFDLTTAGFRGDGTRESWAHGDVPVYPYKPKGRTFHGWSVDTSFRNDLSVELDLQPVQAGDGPIAFSVELRRVHGRWLIDSFFPRTTYAPTQPAAGSNVKGQQEPAASSLPKARTGLFVAVMGAFFTLIVIVPVVFFGAQWFSNRKARKSIYD